MNDNNSTRIDQIRRKYESPFLKAESQEMFSTNRSRGNSQRDREEGSGTKRNHNLLPSSGVRNVGEYNKKGKENAKVTQEEELIKKLFQIKQTFSSIPNWEKHAKKILFDQSSEASTPKYGLKNIINTQQNTSNFSTFQKREEEK